MNEPEVTPPSSLEVAAAQVESLMPRIARRLFVAEPGDPVSDLPSAQLKMCSALQYGASAITALAAELSISVSAATQLADRLERSGIVERSGNAADRRVRLVSLTEHGNQVMERRRKQRIARVTQALSRMTEPERCTLMASLHTLLVAAWGDETGSNPLDVTV